MTYKRLQCQSSDFGHHAQGNRAASKLSISMAVEHGQANFLSLHGSREIPSGVDLAEELRNMDQFDAPRRDMATRSRKTAATQSPTGAR